MQAFLMLNFPLSTIPSSIVIRSLASSSYCLASKIFLTSQLACCGVFICIRSCALVQIPCIHLVHSLSSFNVTVHSNLHKVAIFHLRMSMMLIPSVDLGRHSLSHAKRAFLEKLVLPVHWKVRQMLVTTAKIVFGNKKTQPNKFASQTAHP